MCRRGREEGGIEGSKLWRSSVVETKVGSHSSQLRTATADCSLLAAPLWSCPREQELAGSEGAGACCEAALHVVMIVAGPDEVLLCGPSERPCALPPGCPRDRRVFCLAAVQKFLFAGVGVRSEYSPAIQSPDAWSMVPVPRAGTSERWERIHQCREHHRHDGTAGSEMRGLPAAAFAPCSILQKRSDCRKTVVSTICKFELREEGEKKTGRPA
eukprot:3934188-Rhodomonas_salina.1